MPTVSLEASNISKTFNRRNIFSNVCFSVQHARALAITGRNGSGKSTLMKILAGVLSPSSGTSSLSIDGTQVKQEEVRRYLGFVSPYLQLYDEFTAWENLDFARKLRGSTADDAMLEGLLAQVGLGERKHDIVRTFSSGMKQRLKYAFALLHEPPVLLLDEPTSNLDAQGIAVVYEIIANCRTRGIVIVATNDAQDAGLCDERIDLDGAAASPGGKGR